jgi:hypothetical protein
VDVSDFGPPYRKTFEETLYGLQLVDFAALPLTFDHYSAADQRRIALRMLAIMEADDARRDLDTGPFSISDLTLEQALARLAALAERQSPGGTPA